jgi:hypothetical protein
LYELAKEVQNTEQICNKILLEKDGAGNNVLHHVFLCGFEQTLERIWKLAEEQLTPNELNELLLAQNNHRATALHMAAYLGKVEVLDRLLDWAKEVLNTDE